VDDKVLTDWNGLMVAAMAAAGQRLAEPRFVAAGVRAAEFVLSRLRGAGSGTLLHVYREGSARIPAFLDDYAFLVEGLLALHPATGDERWLHEAARLAAEQDGRLGDGRGGYFAAGEDPRLLFRAKPAYDGAVASGNGIAALNLIELGRRTGDASWRERAAATMQAFGRGMASMPLAHVTLVRALRRLGPGAVPKPVAPAADSRSLLEDEARDVVELAGRLGAGAAPWRSFVLELKVREGWHLNANPASLPSLVATSIEPVLGGLRGVRYPDGEAAGSGGEEVRVYRRVVRIEGEVEQPGGGAPAVQLTYQACDEARCLPPVSRLVRLQ
jgi:hypothetical protein